VVQDYLLADCGVSWGPAEIAYFAQSSVIYEHVLGACRWFAARGFTILDAKAEKLLQKYGLCIENLWAVLKNCGGRWNRSQCRRRLAKISIGQAQVESTLAELGGQIESWTRRWPVR